MRPFEHADRIEYIKAPQPIVPADETRLRETVAHIMREVAARGDEALRDFTKQFDGLEIENIRVSDAEIQAAKDACDAELLDGMNFALENISRFARAQLATMQPLEVETMPGVHLGQRLIPMQRVGAYVPGGRYPLLSSPLMAVIPAKIAGVDEIHVCTPPRVHPAVLYAAHLAGATHIYRVGGAQAIAALTFGTETIPQVDKICGPGNMYVNEAKRQAFGIVGIDQLAGPSEIFILADDTADPKILAADMLAQAEHDVETRVGMITTSRRVGEETLKQVERQLEILSTAGVAGASWKKRGEIALVRDEADLIAYSDYVAAEHLQIHTKNADELAARLRNYGSLFIGQDASVVYSDKVVGTNHILPTGGAAHYTGGLWVGAFLKVCTHQRIERGGVEVLAPYAVRQSANEGLEGHRKAAEIRMNYDVV